MKQETKVSLKKLGIKPDFYKKPAFYVGALFNIVMILAIISAINQPYVEVSCEPRFMAINPYGDEYLVDFINDTAYEINVTQNRNATTIDRIKYGLGLKGEFK